MNEEKAASKEAVAALVAAAITVLLWASAFVVIRSAGDYFSAGSLALGRLPTALAFTTWAYALSRTTATNMGATTYIVPVLTVLLAWAFLGQLPPWLSLVGGTLCLIGVGVTRSKRHLAWRREPSADLADQAVSADQVSR